MPAEPFRPSRHPGESPPGATDAGGSIAGARRAACRWISGSGSAGGSRGGSSSRPPGSGTSAAAGRWSSCSTGPPRGTPSGSVRRVPPRGPSGGPCCRSHPAGGRPRPASTPPGWSSPGPVPATSSRRWPMASPRRAPHPGRGADCDPPRRHGAATAAAGVVPPGRRRRFGPVGRPAAIRGRSTGDPGGDRAAGVCLSPGPRPCWILTTSGGPGVAGGRRSRSPFLTASRVSSCTTAPDVSGLAAAGWARGQAIDGPAPEGM
jgi:hypothetical protein